MIMFKEVAVVSFIVIVLQGCATTYKPTANVLDMSHRMSKNDAIRVMRSALINPKREAGICQANGIPDTGLLNNGWEVNEKNPQVKTTTKSISFNAYRQMLSHSTSGNIATQGSAGLVTSTSTNLKPIRRSIKYADIESAKIYYTSSAMNRLCYIPEGHAEVRINLATGMGHWVSVIIENKNLERFIAAIMIIAPQAEILTG